MEKEDLLKINEALDSDSITSDFKNITYDPQVIKEIGISLMTRDFRKLKEHIGDIAYTYYVYADELVVQSIGLSLLSENRERLGISIDQIIIWQNALNFKISKEIRRAFECM